MWTKGTISSCGLNSRTTTTLAQRSSARKEFLNFKISDDESFLTIKQRYNELLRKVTIQGGEMKAGNRFETLLGALPKKYDISRESFFAQIPAPTIEYVWDRMFDIETTEKRTAIQSRASAMFGECYYITRGCGSFRGRGRGSGSGRGTGRGSERGV